MLIDILVFAAHPDDAEISMGGTIAKMTAAGLKVGVIDLSQGELGTRGTAITRKQEADASSKILKLSLRENLFFKDGSLRPNDEYVKMVVSKIRKHQPRVIFAPYINDRHPDHVGTSQIVKEAMFFSGLAKITTEDNNRIQIPFRPEKLYYYMQTYDTKPSFVVDISDTFQTKMESIYAYETQFHNPESKEPETFISQPTFLKFIESRAQLLGFKIGKEYGEGFFCEEEIELDIVGFVKQGVKK